MVAPAIIAAGIGAASSLLGGLLGRSSAEEQAEKDRKLQMAFAQQGIRWKVADAQAAGIHPLYALGAPTASYSPVAFNDPLPQAIANAGQDISYGINATRTAAERVDAYGKTVQALNVERMGLENTLLASQIAKLNQAGAAAPLPGVVPVSEDVSLKTPYGVPASEMQNEFGEFVGDAYGFLRWLRSGSTQEPMSVDLSKIRDWFRAGPPGSSSGVTPYGR